MEIMKFVASEYSNECRYDEAKVVLWLYRGEYLHVLNLPHQIIVVVINSNCLLAVGDINMNLILIGMFVISNSFKLYNFLI